MNTITDRIQEYWTQRSLPQLALRQEEIGSGRIAVWQEYISSYLPKSKKLRILDVGTGTGFLAVAMALLGHSVTGIDLTQEMLSQALTLSKEQGVSLELIQMDASKLLFADNSFDAVVSRNLTWTLSDPLSAYSEWFRVVKPHGILLNFDADCGDVSFAQQKSEYESAYKDHSETLLQECDDIKNSLAISGYKRPEWDKEALFSVGFTNVYADTEISSLFYDEEDSFYYPLPLFCLHAEKP